MAFYQRAFGWRFENWDGPMDGTLFGVMQFDAAAG
jgi:predicted enzyme related to lactoylglutathione lyase